MTDSIIRHADTSLGISKVQKQFESENKYLDINLSAKFLCWLLLEAHDELYTGDIIGIYNKKYQLLWHDREIEHPYPNRIAPP